MSQCLVLVILVISVDYGEPPLVMFRTKEHALKVISSAATKHDDREFMLMTTQSEPSDYVKSKKPVVFKPNQRMMSTEVDQKEVVQNETFFSKLRHICCPKPAAKPSDMTAAQHQRLIERYRTNRFPKNLQLIVSDELKKLGLLQKLDYIPGLNETLCSGKEYIRNEYTNIIPDPYCVYQEISPDLLLMDNEDYYTAPASRDSLDDFMHARLRAKFNGQAVPSPQECHRMQYRKVTRPDTKKKQPKSKSNNKKRPATAAKSATKRDKPGENSSMVDKGRNSAPLMQKKKKKVKK